MVSVNNLQSSLSISNLSNTKLEQKQQVLSDNQNNKVNIAIKKDSVELQSFLKGAAISSAAILVGVKFASNFSPDPKVLLGASAIAIGTGVIGANLLKGKETNFEKVAGGAAIAGGIIGYAVASKVGEAPINGIMTGLLVGELIGVAAGQIMEKKPENKK